MSGAVKKPCKETGSALPFAAACLSQRSRCPWLHAAGALLQSSLTNYGASSQKSPHGKGASEQNDPLRTLFLPCDLGWRCIFAVARLRWESGMGLEGCPRVSSSMTEGQVDPTGANFQGSVITSQSPGSPPPVEWSSDTCLPSCLNLQRVPSSSPPVVQLLNAK